jgi:MFS family permease
LVIPGSRAVAAEPSVRRNRSFQVFGLLAGAVADRVDRRRIMVTCDLASACLLGLIPLAAHLHLLTGPLVYAAALGAGVAFVWFDAANFGALPALVGRDQLTSANAILFATSTVVEIAGPTLGGVLAALLGPATAIAVDAASYPGSAVLLSLIPRAFARTSRPSEGPSTSRLAHRIITDIRQGLRFLWRQRLVRTLTLLVLWELTYTMVTVNTITIRQLVTPDHLQGRVNATGRLLGWGLGWPLGAALGGVIANLTSVRVPYLVMAAVVLVVTGAAWLSPLRHPSPVSNPDEQ